MNNEFNDIENATVISKLRIFTFFNRLFSSNIHEKNNNQKQSTNYLKSGNTISKINHKSSKISSALIPTFQKSIAPRMSMVNIPTSLVTGRAAINTTTIFEQTAENIFNWALVIVNINYTLAMIKYDVNGN